MKIPNRIQPLVDDGLIDDVVRRLKSGKEADVYTVLCGEEIRCAKVYKEATQRSFKQAVQYQEGRKVRNSRNARAMQKGSKFGRKQQEESGRRRKSMRCFVWQMPACAFRSPISASTACC